MATVVAFGSADSHDEHYFAEPDEMIRGNVVDPVLTLDNREIVRRHVRAFLLQSYLHERMPDFDPERRHDLFSVLGTVSGFRDGATLPNRDDFARWLAANAEALRSRVSTWIPSELADRDRKALLDALAEDCLDSIDDAIRPTTAEVHASTNPEDHPEVPAEEGEERAPVASATDKLLDRLLYCGKLPPLRLPHRCRDVPRLRPEPVDTLSSNHAVRAPTGTIGRTYPVRARQASVDFRQMLHVKRNLLRQPGRPLPGVAKPTHVLGVQRVRVRQHVRRR